MDCMARMAVTKENKSKVKLFFFLSNIDIYCILVYFLKIKIIESGMVNIFKNILNLSNFCEEQNKTLICIWNLCFDEKVIKFFNYFFDLEKMSSIFV